MRHLFIVLLLSLPGLAVLSPAQNRSLLQSGPMLGYVDMKEALIWVQTRESALVYVEYWDKDKPARKYKTSSLRTEKASGYTAKCIADQVQPGKSYQYRVYINKLPVALPYPTEFKTQPLWQWRTDPPEFALVTGSCAYINETEFDRPGKPYGSDYEIFTQIHRQKPDLMLWLGDNAYYREPDWATRTGMLHRYTHSRSLPELQPLLASTHHYAIWDDHDFGPDNSDRTWPHKETSWEIFRAFWGNPSFGIEGRKGCTSWFQYADVDFFLLDDRYFRTPDVCPGCPRTMLGREQVDWFLSALGASRAPFKIVAIGNQFITSNAHDETFAGLYQAERDSILAYIERAGIKGVVFLTGDRHFTELSALKNGAGNWVYDLTTSPFTAGVNTRGPNEENTFRVEGTVVAQHNFSMLRFSGPRKNRNLDITVYNYKGEEQWHKRIAADQNWELSH